jgi:hypothetical protein
VCQVRVEVPGFATSFGRPSKTELATVLLGRSRLEPFASIAALLLATGLRLDWSPPVAAAGDPGAGARWGRIFVRLKLRMDAMNRPVVPDARRARAARKRVTAPHA